MNHFPGSEEEALNYYLYQQKLLEDLKRENPSLFNKMLKAGMLAILGAIGAHIIEQDPMKGAAAGAVAPIFFNKRK